jgi:DNA-binding transcriptional regulator GbsR (MarR family)
MSRTLIEDLSVHIGHAMGWPPMAGRVSGVLMLSEAPLTLAELQRVLDASKGSISEITRLLIANGTVERYKPAGSRHFVYRWRDDAWIGCLRHQFDQTTQLLALAEIGQERAAQLPETQRARFKNMLDYYRFMVRQLEGVLIDYTRRYEAHSVADSQ